MVSLFWVNETFSKNKYFVNFVYEPNQIDITDVNNLKRKRKNLVLLSLIF